MKTLILTVSVAILSSFSAAANEVQAYQIVTEFVSGFQEDRFELFASTLGGDAKTVYSSPEGMKKIQTHTKPYTLRVAQPVDISGGYFQVAVEGQLKIDSLSSYMTVIATLVACGLGVDETQVNPCKVIDFILYPGKK